MKIVPKRLLHPKRKTIGVRVPDNNIALELLAELGEPILSTTLHLPGEEFPMFDPYDMKDSLANLVDLIIDGGYCGMEPTSVIEILEQGPQLVRAGKGADELPL
jgi:tRNA threonylcarbamoyl adenosine modification protein (Sua5/YciO/YrdC/YwlC family)